MAGEPEVTIIGNATADPEIKFTTQGTALATVTVASTPRRYDKSTGKYIAGEALFLRCTAWRELAENMVESIARGQRLIVHGRLEQRNWTTDDGANRSMLQLQVDEIGPSLRWATAEVRKAQRSKPAEEPATMDPWAADAPF